MRKYLDENDQKECPKCGTFMKVFFDGGMILDINPPLYPYDWRCPYCNHEEAGSFGHNYDATQINETAQFQNQARLAGGWRPTDSSRTVKERDIK